MEPLRLEEVQKRLIEVAATAEQLGLSIIEALDFLQKNLEQRVEILIQFREDLSDDLAIEYLTKLLKTRPTPQFLEAVRTKRKNVVLTDQDRHILEVRQKNRCALCGKSLFFINKPHIDHKVPISRHGDNSINNLQILCAQCNLGKGALFGWPLSAPFYEDQLSAKVRFFALSRANGKCEMSNCERTWLDSNLTVHTKVQGSRGGRTVLDNLRILCSHHSNEETRKTMLSFTTSAIKCVATVDEDESLSVFNQNFKKLARRDFD